VHRIGGRSKLCMCCGWGNKQSSSHEAKEKTGSAAAVPAKQGKSARHSGWTAP
jgi:hypothetical protein